MSDYDFKNDSCRTSRPTDNYLPRGCKPAVASSQYRALQCDIMYNYRWIKHYVSLCRKKLLEDLDRLLSRKEYRALQHRQVLTCYLPPDLSGARPLSPDADIHTSCLCVMPNCSMCALCFVI